MIKEIEKPLDGKDLLENYKKILHIMMPLIPHFSSECLEDLKTSYKPEWPTVNKEFLKIDEIEIVIQINGKKRSTIQSTKNINEKTLIQLMKKNEKINKFIENKKIVRTIYVKNRLINLIIK